MRTLHTCSSPAIYLPVCAGSHADKSSPFSIACFSPVVPGPSGPFSSLLLQAGRSPFSSSPLRVSHFPPVLLSPLLSCSLPAEAVKSEVHQRSRSLLGVWVVPQMPPESPPGHAMPDVSELGTHVCPPPLLAAFLPLPAGLYLCWKHSPRTLPSPLPTDVYQGVSC